MFHDIRATLLLIIFSASNHVCALETRLMKKNLLLLMLLIAFLFEAFLTCIAFFNPTATLNLFKLTYNADTALLAYFSAWFLLLISSICVYLLWLVKTNRPGARGVINLLSLWWVGLGIAIYFMFQRPDNLLTDSLKVAILLLLNYLHFSAKGRDLHNETERSAHKTRSFFLGL